MKEKGILYLIADFSRGEQVIEEALKAGVDYIQLREKGLSSAQYLQRSYRMKEMAETYKTPFILNDRLDIAMICGADGVHLGQEDIPIREARCLLGPDKIIGATAKTPSQALAAQKEGADYIGSGAWFPTRTKPDAIPMDQEIYRKILDTISIPNLAVGGIVPENGHIPLAAGASGLAVSEGILGSVNIRERILRIRSILFDAINLH